MVLSGAERCCYRCDKDELVPPITGWTRNASPSEKGALQLAYEVPTSIVVEDCGDERV